MYNGSLFLAPYNAEATLEHEFGVLGGRGLRLGLIVVIVVDAVLVLSLLSSLGLLGSNALLALSLLGLLLGAQSVANTGNTALTAVQLLLLKLSQLGGNLLGRCRGNTRLRRDKKAKNRLVIFQHCMSDTIEGGRTNRWRRKGVNKDFR